MGYTYTFFNMHIGKLHPFVEDYCPVWICLEGEATKPDVPGPCCEHMLAGLHSQELRLSNTSCKDLWTFAGQGLFLKMSV